MKKRKIVRSHADFDNRLGQPHQGHADDADEHEGAGTVIIPPFFSQTNRNRKFGVKNVDACAYVLFWVYTLRVIIVNFWKISKFVENRTLEPCQPGRDPCKSRS